MKGKSRKKTYKIKANKELEELKEIFVRIWSDPAAMRQAKKIAQAA